jgi:hypothetical protein
MVVLLLDIEVYVTKVPYNVTVVVEPKLLVVTVGQNCRFSNRSHNASATSKASSIFDGWSEETSGWRIDSGHQRDQRWRAVGQSSGFEGSINASNPCFHADDDPTCLNMHCN